MKRGRKSEQFYWKWPHYIIIRVLHYGRQTKDVEIIREFLIVFISIHDKSGLLDKTLINPLVPIDRPLSAPR